MWCIIFLKMSILVAFLLLGVARTKHISYYDNEDVEEPMITRRQERRICAELCMAGLGGEPCGDDCVDMIPQGLPKRSRPQSSLDADSDNSNHTRHSACPVLCENRLGYPLCGCNRTLQEAYNPFFKVDYAQICAYFCIVYEYQIYGCQKCEDFLNPNVTESVGKVINIKEPQDDGIDWITWCKEMCKEGEGGAACYCDLLPMKIRL